MERSPGRLIEQLQNVQIRQRRLIQQLQAENARRICDLADIRQERDAFRKEAARLRKENAELRGRLEEVWTEYQDLKRDRATLARSPFIAGHAHARNSNLNIKIMNNLPVLDEEQAESTTTMAESSITMENLDKAAGCPELEPYLHRALPDTPRSESLQPDPPVSTPRMSGIQTSSRAGQSRGATM